MEYQNSIDYAKQMDHEDPLKEYRNRFYFPQKEGHDVIYFCGNSLGLQPKTVKENVDQEIEDWKSLALDAHLDGKNPWFYYHHFVTEKAARLVGGLPTEVVMMNSLTVNLHLMLVSFYRPTANRYKILVEPKPFPSDHYAIESQAKMHGFEPSDVIIELKPDDGEHIVSKEKIISTIEEYKDELALVMMAGVNYYTGQAFDMEEITKAAHAVGANAGFDLAHAAGNLKLNLHDWDVDFAVWCSYKYLNSGPGGVAGAFVHEKHGEDPELKRFAGWWGHNEEERFQMLPGFKPMKGAAGWQISNAPIFPMAIHKASLDIFDEAGMDALCEKRDKLTGYLEYLVNNINKDAGGNYLKIITPEDPKERGCQLSIIMSKNGRDVFDELTKNGVVADWREPDVIRVAPVPSYNTFVDVYRFAEIMRNAMNRN
ncbi:MAG: kynureninase [Bacteroidia bacterium]|nr:kynureninase [Bacteroidia bacterium]